MLVLTRSSFFTERAPERKRPRSHTRRLRVCRLRTSPLRRLDSGLEEVLPPVAEVLVVLTHHVGVRVAQKLRHLSDADAVHQSVGRVGVSVAVADDAFEAGE